METNMSRPDDRPNEGKLYLLACGIVALVILTSVILGVYVANLIATQLGF